MLESMIHQQQHGYKNGHQLLAGSIRLSRPDQDVVDRLSDLAGTLRPGETFAPYLTGYPLPSRKYYVLARSWQDIEATRSGCVLTRSLIVPMEIWEGASCIPSLVALLRPIDRSVEDNSPLVLPPSGEFLPPVSDPRVSELVEALFLERRQPIVMFDVPEAETIAERLLTAFWPGLRGGFCVSTFALAPRTISGRPFDLIFAPRTARSRFSEWMGRRIDAPLDSPNLPRHRWTDSTSKKIFISSEPSFLTSDFLGLLSSGGDESAFRLSLLWSELLEKSEKSPHAVLGMLDILHSQNSAYGDRLLWITQQIERSIDLAERSLPPSEAWEFLATLLGKFSDQQPPTGIRRQLRRTSVTLAQAEPEVAIQFLTRCDAANQSVSAILLSGLASGLARAAEIERITTLIFQIRPALMLQLLAFSQSFAKFVVREAAAGGWIKWVGDLLNTVDDRLRGRVRRNIVPLLDSPTQAPLLGALLKGVSSKALMFSVLKLWAATRFEIEEFDAPLILAAQDEERKDILRTAVASIEETSTSNRLLLKTLQLTVSDIKWLCDSRSVWRARTTRLLNDFLNRYDDSLLEPVINDITIRDLVLATLLTDIKASATNLARTLLLGQFPLRQFLEVGLQVMQHDIGSKRATIILKLTSRCLEESSFVEDDLLKKIFVLATETIPFRHIIQMATSPKVTDSSMSGNLLLLNGVKGSFRNDVLASVDEITTRLIHRSNGAVCYLSPSAIIAWASIITESGGVAKDAQLRAAVDALQYALSLVNAPASPLVVASFPVVYAELRSGREALGLWDRLSPFDWDRCKVARRELVKTFLKSSWPPSDLLLTALAAGDVGRILEYVARQRNGKKYLTAMEDDLKRFPVEMQHHLVGEFRVLRGDSFAPEDWDD